ncbi:hypothetical protein MNBD_GAMMA04-2148 [hydrothermal vent metagenome]|uniref:PilZ domain-containing protein n=1 Tax=hydrothermal vent metagenome TaxID=652676 RepID=A0A3B0VKK1_9ZZZZ
MKQLNPFKKRQSASQIDRRLEQRHLSHFSATVMQQDQESVATVLNFSKSGLAILSTKPIQPNDIFSIELAFNSERNITTFFKSISCQKVETGYLIGAKLLKPCSQYSGLFTKITQPRHSVVSDCW